MKICILGFGSWGVALACLLNGNGHSVRAWEHDEGMARRLNELREHPYLPGVKIPQEVVISSSIEGLAHKADCIVVALPSHVIPKAMPALAKYCDNKLVVSVSKGFVEDGLLRISQYIGGLVQNAHIVALTGPSHAEEVSRALPTAITAASDDASAAKAVADVFSNDNFRVYTTNDIIGAELGGALKNVIALAAGISDGLGFGDNTKAALMTRGIVEIARLGIAMGAKEHTFAGLSGIGDLIVTCTSTHSRNWRAGNLLAKGKSVDEALGQVQMVVEGVHTAKAALLLSEKHGVDMPIVKEVNKILFKNKNPQQAVEDLMQRDKKVE